MKTYQATIAFDTSVYGSFDFEAPDDKTAIAIARREAASGDRAHDVNWDQQGNRVCELHAEDGEGTEIYELLSGDMVDPYAELYIPDATLLTLRDALDFYEAARLEDIKHGDITASEGREMITKIRNAQDLINPARRGREARQAEELRERANIEYACAVDGGHSDNGRGVCAGCGHFLID